MGAREKETESVRGTETGVRNKRYRMHEKSTSFVEQHKCRPQTSLMKNIIQRKIFEQSFPVYPTQAIIKNVSTMVLSQRPVSIIQFTFPLLITRWSVGGEYQNAPTTTSHLTDQIHSMVTATLNTTPLDISIQCGASCSLDDVSDTTSEYCNVERWLLRLYLIRCLDTIQCKLQSW